MLHVNVVLFALSFDTLSVGAGGAFRVFLHEDASHEDALCFSALTCVCTCMYLIFLAGDKENENVVAFLLTFLVVHLDHFFPL